MADHKKKALFICLGNICRSPIAEGVFQKTVNDQNLGEQWEIDSAAIGGWHVGNPPDWRALDTMKNHNVPYNNTARQLIRGDIFNPSVLELISLQVPDNYIVARRRKLFVVPGCRLLLVKESPLICALTLLNGVLVFDPGLDLFHSEPAVFRRTASKYIQCVLTSEDFNYYDYIFGMDESNMKDLNRKAPKGSKAKLLLFGDFDPQGDRIIRDPYYDSDAKGFEKCYQQSIRCSKGFLEQIQKGDV